MALHQIFKVTTGNVPGTCDGQLAALNLYLRECVNLVEASLRVLSRWRFDPNARAIVRDFFGVQAGEEYDQNKMDMIRRSVHEYLLGHRPRIRPLLYIGTDWLQGRNWNDYYMDRNGQYVYGANGQPIRLNNIHSYYPAFINNLFPFWAPALNKYFFEECRPPLLPCQEENVQGITWDDGAIALCPSSFTERSRAIDLKSRKIKNGVHIDHLMPKSSTLYHEVFHLVLGCDETLDTAGSLTEVFELARSPQAHYSTNMSNLEANVQNPETYVYFGLACYYYANKTGRWRYIFDNAGFAHAV